MAEDVRLTVEVEPYVTDVEVEPYVTDVEVEVVAVETWFYYLHPAQTLREDKEVPV